MYIRLCNIHMRAFTRNHMQRNMSTSRMREICREGMIAWGMMCYKYNSTERGRVCVCVCPSVRWRAHNCTHMLVLHIHKLSWLWWIVICRCDVWLCMCEVMSMCTQTLSRCMYLCAGIHILWLTYTYATTITTITTTITTITTTITTMTTIPTTIITITIITSITIISTTSKHVDDA